MMDELGGNGRTLLLSMGQDLGLFSDLGFRVPCSARNLGTGTL